MPVAITLELIKQLREQTGAGISDCRKALQDAEGHLEQAVELIQRRGADKAAKRADRQVKCGLIDSYIHLEGRIGVLIEVNCETDFVARTEDFRKFVKDVAMQVAAMEPRYLSRNDIPAELVERDRQAFAEEVAGKPQAIVDKIVNGKLEKRYQEVCLLDQTFIKDDSMSIGDYLNSMIAKTGENIVIRRYSRYQLGD